MKINKENTLYELVNNYPETKDYLISKGLEQVKNEKILSTLGKKLTLGTVIKTKKLNEKLFLEGLDNIINDTVVDSSILEAKSKTSKKNISMRGVLPCPVRIPLMERLEEYVEKNHLEDELDYELKAASSGLDWLKEDLEKGEIPDVFLSAGFDLFFDKNYIFGLKEEGKFKDLLEYDKYNEDFENENISLRDPKKEYSLIAVVPAVFLVNTLLLKDKKIPTSWKELFSGEYDGLVSLPVGDFDLFNAILLNIYKTYGEEGIRRLGRTFLKSMHPSEMVKSGKGKMQPAITIMPYFFTKMVKENGTMKAVWPEDGAVISPIFMVTKGEKEEDVKEIANFFGSKEIGEVLSHTGLFPSANPLVDNNIPKENKYMWVGWDFIENEDIAKVLEKCILIFNDAANTDFKI